jgi:hypothetical protein
VSGVYRPGWDVAAHIGDLAETEFVTALRLAHVESKADKECRRTGNVAIEIRQGHPDKGQGRLSGISVTTAEWWAIEYADDCWLVMRTSLLKAIVRSVKARHGTVMGGDNHNELVLVPLVILMRAQRLKAA